MSTSEIARPSLLAIASERGQQLGQEVAAISPFELEERWERFALCGPIGRLGVAGYFTSDDEYCKRVATQICQFCPVKEQCLNDALTGKFAPIGVRGGLTHGVIKRKRSQH